GKRVPQFAHRADDTSASKSEAPPASGIGVHVCRGRLPSTMVAGGTTVDGCRQDERHDRVLAAVAEITGLTPCHKPRLWVRAASAVTIECQLRSQRSRV